METPICPICNRILGTQNTSKHHLIPKSRGGKDSELIEIHNICHQKIHSVFSLKELRDEFNTVEKLVEHEEMVFGLFVVEESDEEQEEHHVGEVRQIPSGVPGI